MPALVFLAALLCSNWALGQPEPDRASTKPTERDAAVVEEVLGYRHEPITNDAPGYAPQLFDGWNRTILSLEFSPPADAPRLIHFSDGKTYDTLSASYLLDGHKVRLIHTRFILVMEFELAQELPTSIDSARQFVIPLLARIFTQSEKLHVSVHEMVGGFCGRQPPLPRRPDGRLNGDDLNWTDTVHWWLTEGRLRLACIKIQPHSSAVLTTEPEWFRLCQPRPED